MMNFVYCFSMVLDMAGFAKIKKDGILEIKFSFLFVFNALCVTMAKTSK